MSMPATPADTRPMPEVMAERRYPTGTSTPRWTREGLARAVANMPREPKVRGRKGMGRAA